MLERLALFDERLELAALGDFLFFLSLDLRQLLVDACNLALQSFDVFATAVDFG